MKKRKFLFSEIVFSSMKNPDEEVSCNQETGQIIIFIRFPLNKLIFRSGLNTYESTTRLTTLVCNCVFREIAKRRLMPDSQSEKIEQENHKLQKTHGMKFFQEVNDYFKSNKVMKMDKIEVDLVPLVSK